MINTQLRFEGKILTVQKLLYPQGIIQIFNFQGQFDLEGQGQGHQFSNPSETFRCLIKAMPHGSDFYNEFAKIHQIYEKSYRAMEFSTKSL